MTPDMSYEREGAWQSNAQKIRVDGTEKKRKHERMNFLHVLVRVLIGWVLYQPIIQKNINTRYLEV